MPNQAYWDRLNAKHAEYEAVVGKPFENFIELCSGNVAIASLYFGQAYWNAKGITKYDKKYEQKIEQLEKKTSRRFQAEGKC